MKPNTNFILLWQTFAITAMLILLSACEGSNSKLAAGDNTIEISNTGVTKIVDGADPYELIISGSNNSITIAQNNRITAATISGNNNMVTVSTGTTVDSLTFTGSDNVVIAPAGTITTTTYQGTGNRVDLI